MKTYYSIQSVKPKHQGFFYDEKTPQEISIALFGECNLRCNFCVDNLRFDTKCHPEYFQYTIKAFEKAIAYTKKSNIIIRVFGGELLQDKFSDAVYLEYKNFFLSLANICNAYNKQFKTFIATNLVHKKASRVLDLLKECNIQLSASFDLHGRFNKQSQIDLFLENCELYSREKLLSGIGFLASRDNINALMKSGENVNVFEVLYNKYRINFDYFSPNSYDTKQITEEELSTFCEFLLAKYPKIENIQNLVCAYKTKHASKYPCPGILIAHNTLIYQCCDFSYAEKQYIKNKNCFSCKHFAYCSHPCIRLMSGHSGCHVKYIFDKLESKGYE